MVEIAADQAVPDSEIEDKTESIFFNKNLTCPYGAILIEKLYILKPAYKHIKHNKRKRDKMVSITLAVTPELKKEMDKHPELNWSEIARQSIKSRIDLLNKMDSLLANSKLTEEDALRLGEKVNRAVSKKYRERIR